MNIEDKKNIYQAISSGDLFVKSSSKDKQVEWKKVTDVLRHEVSFKDQYKISVEGEKSVTVTGDHSLYTVNAGVIEELFARTCVTGMSIAGVESDRVIPKKIISIIALPPEQFMYDLSVEDNHNFVLESGILAHNTFRPPASEKFIQGQTRVFGFIWEDEELLEFLQMGVDDFNSRPPTQSIALQDLWLDGRRWRTTILLRAAAFACFAVAMTWIANEFSVKGEEMLRVRDEEGNIYTLSMEELFDIIYGDLIRDVEQKARVEVKKSIQEVIRAN